MTPVVRTGLDVLCAERLQLCRGRRVAVLCHPASVDSELVHIVDRLVDAGVRPVRLFGPEHGVRGEAQDMVGVDGGRDDLTGVPVCSLYGSSFESLSPPAETLRDVDVLIVDLQDVGSRYYTYVWTMGLAMQAAARAGVSVVVLDRPNPLGGIEVEGGQVAPETESFVGMGSVPVRHGLTIGELARIIQSGPVWAGTRFGKSLDLELTVIPMQGWRREMSFEATGLPWVLPSPNMPTPDTAFVYPGMCLVEGTNLSEGRGTTRPFELFGAPFLDGHALSAALAAEDLPGVRFRPAYFRPTNQKWNGRPCAGVQLHVTDRARFRPYRTGVAALAAARRLAPEGFRWRTEPYEFVANRPAIDLLTGGEAIRRGIEEGWPLADLQATWRSFEREFAALRRPFLMY